MFDNRYLYSASRTKALESQLLDRNIIERMILSKNAEEAYKVLSETSYASSLSETESYRDYEQLILLETMKTKAYIDEVSPEQELTGLFYLKYDVHNIKVFLKSMLLHETHEDLYMDVGTMPLKVLIEMLNSNDLSALNPEIAIGVASLMESLALSPVPQHIDGILDKALYNAMTSLAKKSKSSFISEILQTQIDLINIKTFIRIKTAGHDRRMLEESILENGKLDLKFFETNYEEPLSILPGKLFITGYSGLLEQALDDFAASSSLVLYEKLADDLIFEKVKQAKFIAFGIEPIIGYILAKENEAKIIRMIMICKINAIPIEVIRERVSEVYV